MAKIRPTKRSFNAGILSPVMYGQVDFDKWASAVKSMKNFIPLPQGPARRRGGTQYAGTVKDSSARVWLASFQFSTTEAFILEFGPEYIRFWFNHAQLWTTIIIFWKFRPLGGWRFNAQWEIWFIAAAIGRRDLYHMHQRYLPGL